MSGSSSVGCSSGQHPHERGWRGSELGVAHPDRGWQVSGAEREGTWGGRLGQQDPRRQKPLVPAATLGHEDEAGITPGRRRQHLIAEVCVGQRRTGRKKYCVKAERLF